MNYYKVSLVDCFLNNLVDLCYVKSFKTKKDLRTFLSKDVLDRYQFIINKCLKRDIPFDGFCLYDRDYKSRCEFISFGREFFK